LGSKRLGEGRNFEPCSLNFESSRSFDFLSFIFDFMKMSKLIIIYIASLIILGLLIAVTVFKPMATGEEYSEVQRAQLLEREDRWIIELHIFNPEAQDTDYTINVLVDEELCTESIQLKPGGLFKYNHHISRDNLDQAIKVLVAVHKDGEATPFEQTTYYLE